MKIAVAAEALTPRAAADWNPYYVAYAAAHGKTPEEMLAHDTTAWPGGKMAGYILWINAHWSRWFIERKKVKGWHARSRHQQILSQEDHNHFKVWLQRQYPAPKEST